MNRIISLAMAGLLMSFASNAAGAAEKLSQAELSKLFPGSFIAVVRGMVKVNITAKGNGELIGQMKSREDTGRWSLRNGQLCISMAQWTGGRASCSVVVADNGWYRGNGVRFKRT